MGDVSYGGKICQMPGRRQPFEYIETSNALDVTGFINDPRGPSNLAAAAC